MERGRTTGAASNMKQPLGVYVHWPFCQSKCPYCDFNSYVVRYGTPEQWHQGFVRALDSWKSFLDTWVPDIDFYVQSLFFGGGTPSLMPPDLLAAIVEKVRKLWPEPLVGPMEISMEMNPSSFEAAKMEAFYQGGINRLSIGVQSLRPQTLNMLGRMHSAAEAIKTVEAAQKRFTNLSVDLMYGHSHHGGVFERTWLQHPWYQELREILSLQLPHISLYHLTYEANTPFHRRLHQGLMTELPEEESIFLMEKTHQMLEKKGLFRYEVSNYSCPGYACAHNTLYWKYGQYIGVGPGAHGRIHTQDAQGKRVTYGIESFATPKKWLEAVCQGFGDKHVLGIAPMDTIEPVERVKEALMMGLRLTQGLEVQRIQEVTGKSLWEWIPPAKWAFALENQWIEQVLPGVDGPTGFLREVQPENPRSLQNGPKNRGPMGCLESVAPFDQPSPTDTARLRVTTKGLQRLDGILSALFQAVEESC